MVVARGVDATTRRSSAARQDDLYDLWDLSPGKLPSYHFAEPFPDPEFVGGGDSRPLSRRVTFAERSRSLIQGTDVRSSPEQGPFDEGTIDLEFSRANASASSPHDVDYLTVLTSPILEGRQDPVFDGVEWASRDDPAHSVDLFMNLISVNDLSHASHPLSEGDDQSESSGYRTCCTGRRRSSICSITSFRSLYDGCEPVYSPDIDLDTDTDDIYVGRRVRKEEVINVYEVSDDDDVVAVQTDESLGRNFEALYLIGVFDAVLINYLSVQAAMTLKAVNSFLCNSINRNRFPRSLLNILIFCRREVGLGSLEDDENNGSGLLGGGFLDQRSIAALNSTCRGMKLATELVFTTRTNSQPSAFLSTVIRNRQTSLSSSSFSRPMRIPSARRCTEGSSRQHISSALQEFSPLEATTYRCLVTPFQKQINFSTLTSLPTAISILRRVDPRMVTKLFGTLAFFQEGRNRQSAAESRADVAKELCSSLRFMNNISSIDLSNWPTNDLWFSAFANSIASGVARRLSEVRLTYPAIDGTSSKTFSLSAASLSQLCSALATQWELEVLDLSGVIIRDDIARPLVSLIASKQKLKKVWLRSTKLGDEFLIGVCLALRDQFNKVTWEPWNTTAGELPGLTHLCLQYSNVTDRGVLAVADVYDEILAQGQMIRSRRSRSLPESTFLTCAVSHPDKMVLPRILLGSSRNVSREVKASVKRLGAYISFN